MTELTPQNAKEAAILCGHKQEIREYIDAVGVYMKTKGLLWIDNKGKTVSRDLLLTGWFERLWWRLEELLSEKGRPEINLDWSPYYFNGYKVEAYACEIWGDSSIEERKSYEVKGEDDDLPELALMKAIKLLLKEYKNG